jgi:hypothetical protein
MKSVAAEGKAGYASDFRAKPAKRLQRGGFSDESVHAAVIRK